MSRDDEPFANTIYLSAVDGKEAELTDVLLETVGKALAAPGARGFSILQSTANASDFMIVERWGSEEAMQAGAEDPVLTNALAVVADRTLVSPDRITLRWTRII